MFAEAKIRLCLLVLLLFSLSGLFSTSLRSGRDTPLVRSIWRSEGEVDRISERNAKIGKVLMLYGDSNPLYERALANHDLHNENFGYPMYTLREQILSKYWSKPAYILSLLVQELAKPKIERLEWMVWFDADVVLMNHNIPLEIFLPPEDSWSHINAMVTNDHHGLNNGVFFLRVHHWSVWLMTATMATSIYEPHIKFDFADQSALERWIVEDDFRDAVMHMPQRWFNAFAGYRGKDPLIPADPWSPQTKFRKNAIKEGDLLVHHAGSKSKREMRMTPWMDAAEMHTSTWEVALEDTTYLQEIEDFWAIEAPKESQEVDRMRVVMEEKKAEKLAQE